MTVGAFYLSEVIIIVVLDGVLPRLCGDTGATPSTRSKDILLSVYEEPRMIVHNVPPDYDKLTTSSMHSLQKK
uniref:Uncharacterized protein n=1 Tax=Onchocerca volvulus TaxID=6282 RepID=A0A8R1TXR1_ONCVO